MRATLVTTALLLFATGKSFVLDATLRWFLVSRPLPMPFFWLAETKEAHGDRPHSFQFGCSCL
jgi:hypothetical protein